MTSKWQSQDSILPDSKAHNVIVAQAKGYMDLKAFCSGAKEEGLHLRFGNTELIFFQNVQKFIKAV